MENNMGQQYKSSCLAFGPLPLLFHFVNLSDLAEVLGQALNLSLVPGRMIPSTPLSTLAEMYEVETLASGLVVGKKLLHRAPFFSQFHLVCFRPPALGPNHRFQS